jgi:hypothetical protein
MAGVLRERDDFVQTWLVDGEEAPFFGYDDVRTSFIGP